MSGPSDHAARAPSEAAVNGAAEVWAMFEVRGPGTLMGPNEALLAAWLDAFARSARKQALEDAARVAENRIRREAERTHVAAAIRALAQEEAP